MVPPLGWLCRDSATAISSSRFRNGNVRPKQWRKADLELLTIPMSTYVTSSESVCMRISNFRPHPRNTNHWLLLYDKPERVSRCRVMSWLARSVRMKKVVRCNIGCMDPFDKSSTLTSGIEIQCILGLPSIFAIRLVDSWMLGLFKYLRACCEHGEHNSDQWPSLALLQIATSAFSPDRPLGPDPGLMDVTFS